MAKLLESDIEQMAIELLTAKRWEYLYGPTIAPDGEMPMRRMFDEMVLREKLEQAVKRLNPTLTDEERDEAVKTVLRIASPDVLANNEAFHRLLTEGVPVSTYQDGMERGQRVWLIDFDDSWNNEFTVVNQFTIIENGHNRRPDVLLFVNGLPLVIMELKNAADENATIESAYQQIETYKQQIPSLFTYNELIIISDGLEARAGSLSAGLSRFSAWKTEDGENMASPLMSQLEVLINGMLKKDTLLDLVRSFIVFQKEIVGCKPTTDIAQGNALGAQGITTIKTVKKIAAYHQYYAVNKAVKSTLRATGINIGGDRVAESPANFGFKTVKDQTVGDHRAGVVWHTQGCGKSLSMVFYTGKIVQRLNNPTVVIITDRNDLDDRVNRVYKDKPGGLVVDYLSQQRERQGTNGQGQTSRGNNRQIALNTKDMTNIRQTALYLIILLGALLTGCSESGKTYKIGVAQCSQGRWRDKVEQEMLAAQHLYEQDAKVCIAHSHDDTQLQVRQIDSLANAGIDLLVVAPNEAEPVAKAVAKVMARGIPVICFDRNAANDSCTAFIGGSNIEAGQVIGQYVVGLASRLNTSGRKPRVMEITGSMNSTPAQERHRGFAEAMKGHGELEYVCQEGDWTSDEACRIVKEVTGTPRQPDIVFCHNDGMATGVYKAVVETGTEGQIQILGVDGMPGEGLEYVKLGHQVGTYVYPTHGEKIIRLALDILSGQPYQKVNLLHGIMVTPENVDLVTATSLELMEQNDDLITIQDKLEEYFGLYNTQQKVLAASFVTIALLVLAILLILRAFMQTRRLVRQRQTMHEEQTLFYTNPDSRTLRQVFETPQKELPAPRSQDTIFAETLNEAIRKNMANPNLKMDDLGQTVGLSRVQLYRRVKAITGLTPVELLRQMRLQQGYVLLATTTKTVNEIAYEVGFGTPGYFSKCFRQQYGKYPSDLRT